MVWRLWHCGGRELVRRYLRILLGEAWMVMRGETWTVVMVARQVARRRATSLLLANEVLRLILCYDK